MKGTEGMTQSDVMQRMVNVLVNWPEKAEPRMNPRRPLSAGQARLIKRLYADGWGLVDIAHEVRVDESTVSRYISRQRRDEA